MRSYFQTEIALLNQELEDMAQQIETAIDKCIIAFENQDREQAKEIIKGDRKINDLEKAIEARCLSLILNQQPVVAKDLRMVSTALKIVTDMERIGDHAADIAEIVLRMENKESCKNIPDIKEMANAAKIMVKDAMQAFIHCDVKAAKQIIERDDIVDNFFNKVKEEIVLELKKETKYIDDCVDILMTAKYLERIGDHAVNICEWTEFHETGTLNEVKLV